MRIPLSLKCPNCGEPRHQVVHLSDQSADFTCAKCGRTSYGIPGLGVTVGFLILARSWHEFEVEKDYDMTIVLAATALDCELSLLYQKWKEVDAVGNGTTLDTETFERELRGMGSVADKITKISEFLYVGGIETFVASSQQWTNKPRKTFRVFDLARWRQTSNEQFFGPGTPCYIKVRRITRRARPPDATALLG